ncbi:probable galacturonosyltransferase 6 isoform X2 [Tripterygium wilfordii]|uniref:probable galacturonosyltransferase 6 isoform X2 n=1 Tax=Tripterygium wilfordii TaxID=458696 RepID=UPI0018F7F104|nr:probable galacturonosyltransferase 6 isoform X2 [Tripterygium wilfordii]
MKQLLRWQRTLILCMLSFTVLAPLFFVSNRFKTVNSIGRNKFGDDLSSIKYRTDAITLKTIEQEWSDGLKEPKLVVYEDKDLGSSVSDNTLERNSDFTKSVNVRDTANVLDMNVSGTNHEREQDNQKIQTITVPTNPREKLQEKSNQTTVLQKRDAQSQSRRVTDLKVKQIRDQLIRAKAYLYFAPPGSNSNLVRELRVRLKELDRAVGEATKDSDLSRSALKKMRSMEVSLSKGSRVFPDCSAMATKLRAMAYSAEEQVQIERNQAAYHLQLAARTTPKGLHCLSMRLTAEYLALQPEERQLSNQQKFYDPNFYHYAVFSDNILGCAVVVTSTVSSAMDPEKIVFHVVTDALNYPALSMWFLLNPPGNATVQIQSIENFEGLLTKHDSMLSRHKSKDPRYTSALNHLRFYLPDVFPLLNKIVLFDHDVVVQRDLSELWSINMKGKVNGAVETCRESEPSFRRMDMLVNFSDPLVAKRFDVKACTWAFGMNIFDLLEWRKHNLTAIFQRYLQLGYKRPLWKAGSLPLGWVTFYKKTIALDKRWHVLGLGYESGVGRGEIERAAVIHYDGVRKPWLDIGIKKYKSYWSKYVNYRHPYLQECNIDD